MDNYLKSICCICMLLIGFASIAQTNQFKFDFGTGKNVPGYLPVTHNTIFNSEKGYGFSHGSTVVAIDRGGNPLTGDFITSTKPFYFSVVLPEGNYDVTLTLGDKKGSSATTVRTESRRLMVENVQTDKGKISTQTFSVHIRDSLIREANHLVIGKVRLKPREITNLHWDNMLTIEFNDSLPKVCALEIVPNTKATTIFLAGNSTVVDQDREPWAAWGQMFPNFLVPSAVVVANYAESGETLKAFYGEKRLEKIWSMAKPSDYLFIEFAHNDQKPGSSHLDPFTTYKQTLKEWINQAKNKQIIPVLVTSMHRRNFDSTGKIINSLSDFPEAMRQTAMEENVAIIDLNDMSKTLYEAWGPHASIKAFVHYPTNSFPNQQTKLEDNTHFSPYGAYQLARCIVQDIKLQNLTLAAFIKNNVPTYDPSKPLPFEQFYWPNSLFINGLKPDGN